MTHIKKHLEDLRYKIEHCKLKQQTSVKKIPALLKEKGYNVIMSDDSGNFCIEIGESCCIEGVAVSKVNYTLILKISDIVEKYENIYRWDDFLPLIDILLTEAKCLYPAVIETLKKEKQVSVFKTLINGILLTKNPEDKEFLFHPEWQGDSLSLTMYTQLFPGLSLGIKLNTDNYEEKIDRLLKVCSSIPDVIFAQRSITLTGTFRSNSNWDAEVTTVRSEGLNKNYDKKVNRHFVDNPYTAKSEYTPRAKKLVKFLKNKGIEYGYTDKGDFIIQYAPNGDEHGVIRWSDIDFGYSDFHYQISKKGVLKRRAKDFFKGMVENLTEEEVIQLLTLALENKAFITDVDYKILRHSLISAVARNRLPAGLRVSGPYVGRWHWGGKAFSPKLCIRIPDIEVDLILVWESLKQFIAEHNQIDKIIPVIEALRFLTEQDKEVVFFNTSDFEEK